MPLEDYEQAKVNPLSPVYLPEFGHCVSWAMCRNPACKNYGIHYQGPAPVDREIVSDERYHFNANTGQFSCDYCAMASTSLNTTRTGRNPKIDFTAVMIRTRCCVGCVISGFKSVRRCTCHAKGTFLLHLAESNAACCPDMPTYALMINGGMIKLVCMVFTGHSCRKTISGRTTMYE